MREGEADDPCSSISTRKVQAIGMGCGISHIPKHISSIMESFKTKYPPVTRSVFKVRCAVAQDPEHPIDVADLKDIAENPIVTRGVLLDWYAYAQRKCIPHRPFTNQAIPLEELLEVAREQKVKFRRGDILVIRTGWTAAYSKLTEAEKEHLGGRDCLLYTSDAADEMD